MHDLDKIEHLLGTVQLSGTAFERFSTDQLSELYPGLSPISGGTDWGRDADVTQVGQEEPMRLLATVSRSYKGVRANMVGGIRSMREHNVPVGSVVLANPAVLSNLDRQKLVAAAKAEGASLKASDIYDRTFVASRLRRDGFWRNKLLGLSADPISLSRLPVDEAESPWWHLPLVGREQDRAHLLSGRDMLVTGPTGVGKTRLMTELIDAAFVDSTASLDQVADDLRWVLPSVVVIDDAGTSIDHLRRVLWLRQSEPDLFSYRVIASCWPEDVAAVHDKFSSSAVLELDLIERGPLDELLVAMGISGQLARSELLDQAEGRPGWLVALGDLLLRGGGTSILRGAAVLGQVGPFLRRSGATRVVTDLLAGVAALGSIDETEIRTLAEELELTRTQVAEHLEQAAINGIVEISSSYSWEHQRNLKHYEVRPPMLADVLVAEQVFRSTVPTLNPHELMTRWPKHRISLLRRAAIAARLQVSSARQFIEPQVDGAIKDGEIDFFAKIELLKLVATIDKEAGQYVREVVDATLRGLGSDQDNRRQWYESLAALLKICVQMYEDEKAIELLLELASLDDGPVNPRPNHPLRVLQDLVTEFHPEVPFPVQRRSVIAGVLKRWFEQAPPERAVTTAAVLRGALSLHIRAALLAPGDFTQFSLYEGVVPPDLVSVIESTVWAPFRPIVATSPPLQIAVITALSDWLRIGAGYDAPFGKPHNPESIQAAQEAGLRLLREAAEFPELLPSVKAALLNTADNFSVELPVALTDEEELFLGSIDRKPGEWQAAEQDMRDRLQAYARTLVDSRPQAAIGHLQWLQAEQEAANVRWPNRIDVVCDVLAAAVADPRAWFEVSMESGFVVGTRCFVVPTLRTLAGTEGIVETIWDDQHLRSVIVAASIDDSGCPGWVFERVCGDLCPLDYGVLEWQARRGALSEDHFRRLFAAASDIVRGMLSLAWFAGPGDGDWMPAGVEVEWLEGVRRLRPALIPHAPDYKVGFLLRFVATHYPEALCELVIGLIDEVGDGQVYGLLPHEAWPILGQLPPAQKTKLWQKVKSKAALQFQFMPALAGNDRSWLAEMLDAGEMSTDDVLIAQHDPETSMNDIDIAKLLIPRGVAPEAIAQRSLFGGWSGPQSAHYAKKGEAFVALIDDEDEYVRRLGQAGAALMEQKSKEAAERERKERIRGGWQ